MPGANLRMPLKHLAVRQWWKDPSLELKLQYHDVKKIYIYTKPCIQNSTRHVSLPLTWSVALEKSQLQLEDYSIFQALPTKKLDFKYFVFLYK